MKSEKLDNSLTLISLSDADTHEIGKKIGKKLLNADILLLYGEMGAGKTRITAGIAEGIGSKVSARSPTFVIINEYKGEKTLYHCDLFRITDSHEAYDLDLSSKFDSGATVVEWPDNFEELFERNVLKIYIKFGKSENERKFYFRQTDERSEKLLTVIGKDLQEYSISTNEKQQCQS